MDLKNKKIGIWGFGIVGQSVFNYVKKFTNYVQIIDQKPKQNTPVILQTPENVKKFLEENDYIIASPGIILHEYKAYHHKFLCELDLFAPEYQGNIIAITGTAGKTTVTDFIAQLLPNSIAAGNIGFAMLDILKLNPQPITAVLELSSYQLQYAQHFAPNIAIWTNFFENHLDHHTNMAEYFLAKCNILKNQTKDQKAIVPFELVDKILKTVNYQGQLFTYSINQQDNEWIPGSSPGIHALQNNLQLNISGNFYLENNDFVLCLNNQTTIIFKNFNQLPRITFPENWIVIIATLYLQKQDLSKINFHTLLPQPHRVEFIRHYKNVAMYNDSKATIQESTKQALTLFAHKKIALILGGLSKGANREPLIEYIAKQKNITPFIFGQEKEILATLCKKHLLSYFSTETLEHLLDIFEQHHKNFNVLLFSPAGSSFDQFKNYQDRGDQFKKMIQNL